MLGLTNLQMARFLASQLDAAASLEAVARLFVHLEDRGLLFPLSREKWQLAYVCDDQWLAEIEAAGVPSPRCNLH